MKRRAALAIVSLWPTSRALALMAGDPPDSPVKRLDANVASSPWSGVGSISHAGGVYTGVLIHPRFVLTAGHVAPADVADVRFNLNIDADLSHTIGAARATHHPLFRGFNPQSPAFDLALIELAHAAPAEARAYPVMTSPLATDMEIEIVGYGASGPGAVGITVPSNAALKRVGSNRVDRVVNGGPGGKTPLIYMFTFDAPAVRARAKTRSIGNGRETGLASGDSGSPAFVQLQGRPFLAGINTFTARRPDLPGAPFTYGTECGGQILAPHVDWMRSVIERPA